MEKYKREKTQKRKKNLMQKSGEKPGGKWQLEVEGVENWEMSMCFFC